MNKEDIEFAVNKLNDIYHEVPLEEAGHIIFITELLEELGNTVQNLQKDVLSLKQEILQLEAMIDD